MSDIIDLSQNAVGASLASHKVCRVSYTLNNAQPVRSTIIGDQPLFYMDFGCEIEDEDDGVFFDPSEFNVLESELETLKKEIQSFERLSETKENVELSRAQFEMDKDALSAAPFKKDLIAEMKSLKDILIQSRMAQAYMDFASEHGVSIEFNVQVEDACYDRKTKRILINPLFDQADQVLLAARELRRHWQHRQGALIHPLLFHPDNAVLVNRAQNADLVVSMIRVGWELQLAGHKESWERLDNSSMADLTRSFAREAFMDFRTLNNGQASAAVFETWFLSERCRHEDRKLIKQMLADYQGYVFTHEEDKKNAITPALISALGAMPYGKNYLAPHSQTILTDSVFTEVRDRSNANFLWFIKFERSFRETEQELQTKKEPSAAGSVRSKGAHQQEFTYENAQAKSADIVRIFREDSSSDKAGDKSAANGKILPPKSSVKRNRNKDKKGANVVYLRGQRK